MHFSHAGGKGEVSDMSFVILDMGVIECFQGTTFDLVTTSPLRWKHKQLSSLHNWRNLPLPGFTRVPTVHLVTLVIAPDDQYYSLHVNYLPTKDTFQGPKN